MFHLKHREKEKFDNIISLGYKCETANALVAMFGFADSYLFNWVHIKDIHNLIKFLENPDLLLSKGIEFDYNHTFMYRDCLLDFMYHSKHKPPYFQEGNILQKIEEDKPEVLSRINHLKDKFLNVIKSNQKNLFVMCFKKNVKKNEINDILEKLSAIIYNLSGNKESKIVVIFERFYLGFKKLKKFDNVIVKKTWKFAPDSFAHGINFEFWKNLYSEFEFAFCKNPDYEANMKKYIKDLNIGIINIFSKKYALKDKYYDKIASVFNLERKGANEN